MHVPLAGEMHLVIPDWVTVGVGVTAVVCVLLVGVALFVARKRRR